MGWTAAPLMLFYAFRHLPGLSQLVYRAGGAERAGYEGHASAVGEIRVVGIEHRWVLPL